MYTLANCRSVVKKGTLFKYNSDAMALPPNTQHATVIQYQNSIKGWSNNGTTLPLDTQDGTSYDWMVQNTHQHTNESVISRALLQGNKLMTVSDGSFLPDLQHGTAAWIIQSENSTKSISGNNIVPGSKEAQFSHRSEICGLIGAIHHVNTICHRFNIRKEKVELGCDGEEAFKMATRHRYSSTSKISHHDLTTKLHHLINSSPIIWTFRHVSRHQDNHKSWDEIDDWEQMNIEQIH